MNTIFTSFNTLKSLLLENKSKFTKEEYEYLTSLLQLETYITKNILTTEKLINSEIYYKIILYNVYQAINTIIYKLDTMKFIDYEQDNELSKFKVEGTYKNKKGYSAFDLISIEYNNKDISKINVTNTIYLLPLSNTKIPNTLLNAAIEKQKLSFKLHSILLNELDLPKFSYTEELKHISDNEVINNLDVLTSEKKLTRTLPAVTFTHSLKQQIVTKK